MSAAALQQFKFASENPQYALDEIQRVRSERSLRAFIPHMWEILEPGREFKTGWAIDATCEHLEAVTHGHIKRLLINVPPGFMKSLTTEVFWPAWEWGPANLPSMRYVSASYSEALTVRDNRKTRILVQSPEYRKHWGDRFMLMGDSNAKQRFDNDKTGFKIATSVGGLGTGERGDRFIIDDPHNVKDGESVLKREASLLWFAETVPTRVNDPEKSAIIIIMQRVHERDVSGAILAQELGYEHLMIPMDFEPERKCYSILKPKYIPDAKLEVVTYDKNEKAWRKKSNIINDRLRNNVPEEKIKQELKTSRRQKRYCIDPRTEAGELAWPDRFTKHHLEKELKPQLSLVGGTYAISGQLQQRPVPRGGGMFQRGDFQFLEPNEVAGLLGRKVRGWDLAASDGKGSPYTASCKGMVDSKDRIIILDVMRVQELPGKVLQTIEDVSRQDGDDTQQDIPQDPGQAGKSQKTYIAGNLHGVDFTGSPESGPKATRAAPLSSQAEAKNLYLVRAEWNDAFISEAISFPNGQFLDQIDAASRMYANIVRNVPSLVGLGGKLYN